MLVTPSEVRLFIPNAEVNSKHLTHDIALASAITGMQIYTQGPQLTCLRTTLHR